MSADQTYEMSLSLNVLNHLGLKLYSNVSAVLSEVVANAWDADATQVEIDIDVEADQIVVTDDGHGMGSQDINGKYLVVGYSRREQEGEATTPKYHRPVMGRKGIGKLSLFSIADEIEVHSVRDKTESGFRMSLPDIKKLIDDGKERRYRPRPIPPSNINIKKGTCITLRKLRKKRLSVSISALRKRLARRFSVIGQKHNFKIRLNGALVSVRDRAYFGKIQYLWYYGSYGKDAAELCTNAELKERRVGKVPGTNWDVSGWIGTVKSAGDLSEDNENINKIVLMMRGKLAQEDILEEFAEGGIYTKYILGEILCDFLDLDEQEDMQQVVGSKFKRMTHGMQNLPSFFRAS